MNKTITSLILSIFLLASCGKKEVNFRVAKFKDDKVCAMSYTFDDALQEH